MSYAVFRRVLPILVAVTSLFAVYQLVMAAFAVRLHSWPYAAIYAVLGVAGLALARALWKARGLLDKPAS